MTARLSRAVAPIRVAAWNHPHTVTAVKAALAATIAWLVVQPLGGFADDYPYYAPLGATVAMSTTVINSVRSSVHAVCAILLGAAVALTVDATQLPELPAIALVIGVGTRLSDWPRLGSMSSWVPFAALFVLIVGGGDPWHYVLAYGGLTALGATVGVAVNWLLPQLPLTPADRAQADLRKHIADQLDELADGISAPQPLSPSQWSQICVSLRPLARRAKELMSEVLESERGNWRAKRWSHLAEQRHMKTQALQRLTNCVDDLIDLVSDPHASLHDVGHDAQRLRAATARALERVSAALSADDDRPNDGNGEGDSPRNAARREAVAAVTELKSLVITLGLGNDGQNLTTAAVVATLERGVDAWR